MRDDVRRRHDAHLRADGVCTGHSAVFDVTAGGRNMRATLGACVADVERLLAVQERSIEDRRAATERRRLMRRTIRDLLVVVVRVGRVVRIAGAVMNTMHMPGPVSDDELVAYARGLIERISPHLDAFVVYGLPPDALTALAAAIARLEAARNEQGASRQRFTAASITIRETLNNADRTIDVLEGIVLVAPAADREVLKTLRIARRVGPRAVASSPALAASAPTCAGASLADAALSPGQGAISQTHAARDQPRVVHGAIEEPRQILDATMIAAAILVRLRAFRDRGGSGSRVSAWWSG